MILFQCSFAFHVPHTMLVLFHLAVVLAQVASGPYQMVGVLGDGIVFSCADGETTSTDTPDLSAEYLEEIPLEYFTERYRGRPRLWWGFGFGAQKRSLADSREGGTLFQVHMWFYPGDCSFTGSTPQPRTDADVSNKQVLRLMETFHTSWNTYSNRLWAGRWIHSHLTSLRPGIIAPPDTVANPANLRDSSASTDARGVVNWDVTHAPRYLHEWASGGHVDIVFLNTQSGSVVVWRSQSASPDAFEQIAVVAPNEEVRWETHERELWQVDTFEGQLIRAWTIDCSLGLVQRYVV